MKINGKGLQSKENVDSQISSLGEGDRAGEWGWEVWSERRKYVTGMLKAVVFLIRAGFKAWPWESVVKVKGPKRPPKKIRARNWRRNAYTVCFTVFGKLIIKLFAEYLCPWSFLKATVSKSNSSLCLSSSKFHPLNEGRITTSVNEIPETAFPPPPLFLGLSFPTAYFILLSPRDCDILSIPYSPSGHTPLPTQLLLPQEICPSGYKTVSINILRYVLQILTIRRPWISPDTHFLRWTCH